MRRKASEFDQIEVPGGGRMPSGSSGVNRTEQLQNMVEQSVRDRGGYPTRGGVPMKTKTQINQDAERQRMRDAPFRTQKFRKGGMVKGGKSMSCKSHVDWSE